MKSKQRHRLSRRLLVYVIACSSLLAILATLTQLFLLYKQDLNQINSNITYIESSYLPSISEAVYRIDDELRTSLMDGVLNLQDIVYIEIIEQSGDSSFITTRGDHSLTKDVRSQFPLTIKFPTGTELELGQLNVYASYEGVFKRLWNRIAIILLTNIAKTLIAGFIIYFIFQASLSRHLIQIAGMVNDMDTEKKDRNYLISLERKSDKADELDQLVTNINTMWVKLFDEIAFRKMSENQLRESEGRYRQMMAASPDPIITYDMAGIVSYINPAFDDTFGWSYDETVGRQINYVPEDSESEIAAIHAAIANDKYFFRFNTCRKRKDGEILDIDLSCGIWRNESGEAGGSVVILRDMTEQVQLGIELQKAKRLEAIGTLAGGIAHDFNNILAVITGQAELMELTDLEPDSRANTRIKEIIKAADQAKHLIGQILAISRHNMVANVPVDLVPLVKETVKFTRSSAPIGIDINYRLTQDKTVVLSDATRMLQVLNNLCGNAVHAIDKENGLIEITLEQITLDETNLSQYADLSPGPYVKLCVSDNGKGIPAEVKDHIFDPYFTTKGISGGTGLGLAVVHGIVKSQKGHISVKSISDQGTTFCILLPHIEADITQDNEKIEAVIMPGNETIMLVDDNQQLLETGAAILENKGYQIHSYSDPLEALEDFKKAPDQFDLVLTDFSMPHLDGSALNRELKTIRPDIKVILTSGFGESITEDSAEQQGFSAFLAKPFETRTLAQTIRTALNIRENS